jgi:ATP-dependent Clp protease ATP-binding subunit ClpB
VVLFIDELHTVVGAGAAEGAMDASNLLKPMLARGELHCIGATTLDEYTKHVEKDAALERRFQPVLVDQPTVDDTISILRGLKERYEVHHGVRIKDAALVSAAVLSHRYISDRFLPDKAIDLVDEAAARLRTEIDSMPAELDEITRRSTQLEIEREALRKETDAASRDRLERLEQELGGLQREAGALREQWEREKAGVERLRHLRRRIEETRTDIERAMRTYDLNRVAELQYGTLATLERELREEEAHAGAAGGRRLIKEEVDEEDIALVVARWTGIPVTKLMEGEMQKLLHLEEELHRRVVGQDEAVGAVADAVVRARAGIKDPRRPIGSFLFLGPTGVGKTELARALAEALFDDEASMVRLDMSEYMEKHTVARLIGAPPGYVGYEEGGQLTEAVRRKPYSVILLDEIEKAHPDVFNVLLQILDDGRLTDGHGRTVNFKHTVVIMTSNIGSQLILELRGSDERSYQRMREQVLEALRRQFRPEFLNRVDEVVVFRALTEAELARIVEIQLEGLRRRLAERRITLEVSEAGRAHLARAGYDPVFGARPLKRAIQREVETPVARLIVAGKVADGGRVSVEAEGDRLRVEPA